MRFKQIHLTSVLLLIVALVVSRWLYLYTPYTAIDVEESLLRKIIAPGKYVGEGTYTPTPLYPNGLTTTNNLVITDNADEQNVHYVNELVARDSKTNVVQYNAVRKGKYFYKPHHGSNLFNSSESYIDGKVVSTSYGYATSKTSDSIDFTIDAAWHVIDDEHDNANKNVKRVDNVLYGYFTHPTFFGGSSLTFNEKYTQIQ
jgi:hypothetical protein